MRRKSIITAGCIALGIAGYFLLRPHSAISFDRDPNAYMIQTMVPIYRSLPFVEVDDFASVRRTLDGMRIFGAEPVEGSEGMYALALTRRLKVKNEPISTDRVSAAMIDQLLDQVAELVYYRMINRDPQRYLDIRAERGAVAPTREQLITLGWGELGPIFNFYLDRDPEPGETTADLVVESFNDWVRRTKTGGLRGIADRSDGSVCAIGLMDSDRDISSDLIDSELGVEGWSGAGPIPSGTFLFPVYTIGETLEKHGALPYAIVGLVVEYNRGPPQAVVFDFFWNPDLNDWQFAGARFVNRRGQDTRILPHF